MNSLSTSSHQEFSPFLPHIHTHTHTHTSSKIHFLEEESPPKSLPSDDVPKPSPDTTTTTASISTSHPAPPISTVRETTPTPSSVTTTPAGGKGGGARNESIGEPQTPSGPGGSSQLSGMFSRLKKRVVDTAWYGTENKVCESWYGNGEYNIQ